MSLFMFLVFEIIPFVVITSALAFGIELVVPDLLNLLEDLNPNRTQGSGLSFRSSVAYIYLYLYPYNIQFNYYILIAHRYTIFCFLITFLILRFTPLAIFCIS